jgi:hypothetical protein
LILNGKPLHGDFLRLTSVLTQQATGDNAIWSFNAPGTLNVQRDITNRTTFDCAQFAALEGPQHVARQSMRAR